MTEKASAEDRIATWPKACFRWQFTCTKSPLDDLWSSVKRIFDAPAFFGNTPWIAPPHVDRGRAASVRTWGF